MILHILNKAPSHTALYEKLSTCIAEGDAVLFIEDGAYHCLNHKHKGISFLDFGCKLYALENDAKARGVLIPNNITPVTYEGFVELSIQHKKSISWY